MGPRLKVYTHSPYAQVLAPFCAPIRAWGVTLQRVLPQADGTYIITNPLHWWRDNEDRFPNLAKMARSVLAIPATQAPSERLFSVAGLTIANDRASLLPEMAEDLIYLHEGLPIYRAFHDQLNA